MTAEYTVIFFVFLAVVACVSAFYDLIVRPVLRDEIRFSLFALRDELRRKAISEEVDPTSESYQYLEWFICRVIDQCFLFTWQRFLIHLFFKTEGGGHKGQMEFEENAPETLRLIRDRALLAMFAILHVNSPILNGLFLMMARRKKREVQTFFESEQPLEPPTRHVHKDDLVTA